LHHSKEYRRNALEPKEKKGATMAERVTCIIRGDANRYSDCRCISELRTDVAKYTRLEAHDKVKAAPGSIYVEVAGSKAIVVNAEREGLKYVRTAPNDTTADNLLKVRDC
jgi:hypothetical protein